MGNWLSKFLRSKTFKILIMLLGGLFSMLTLVVYLDPRPFLQFGYLGVFAFNLFGPGTILIPALSRYMNVVGLAFASALGMVLNDSVGWVVGKSGDAIISHSKRVVAVERTIHKFGLSAIFVWALIPIPHDVTGLIAGYLGFPYRGFVIPAFLGIFTRFLIVGFGTAYLLG